MKLNLKQNRSTGATLPFTPISAIIRHKNAIEAKIADAVAALRVAADKIGEALEDYDGPNAHKADLVGARLTARLFAGLLDARDTPTLALRVFRALANYPNRHPDNAPHVEGGILALELAIRSLKSALELAEQFGAEDIDEEYETPFAALATIRQFAASLSCSAFVFEQEKALDAIVGARRTLALSAA